MITKDIWRTVYVSTLGTILALGSNPAANG